MRTALARRADGPAISADRPAGVCPQRLGAGPSRGAPGARWVAERPANLKRAPLPCTSSPSPSTKRGKDDDALFLEE